MEITKRVSFPIYHYTVELVKTTSVKQSVEKRKRKYGVDGSGQYVAMHLFDLEKGISSVIFPEHCSLGTIVHECFHAIFRMHESVGAKLDNESVAYHLDHLVNKADVLNNKKIPK
jgi:hypothetical protein